MKKLARFYAPFPCFSEAFDIFNWWLLWKNCCNEIIEQKHFEIWRFWTFVEFPLTIWFNYVFLSGNETWEQTITIIMDGHLCGAFLLKALHIHWLYKVYNTCTTFNTSHTHTHIHALMNTLAALQGANLLIRSDTALSIQSTPQNFYTQPFTHTHTPMEQPQGAIRGSVSCLRHPAGAGDWTTVLSGRPTLPPEYWSTLL